MDNRKHKIYFLLWEQTEPKNFLQVRTNSNIGRSKLITYECQTGRVLYLMFYRELEIPEDYENRWAQADAAEDFRKYLDGIFWKDFYQCGEQFLS